MNTPATTARAAFLRSPHHAAVALATLGAGFAMGEPLALIAGAAAYVLGWVYLPDMTFFTRWREKKAAEAEAAARLAELGDFAAQRDAMLAKLSPDRRNRHTGFCRTCQQIAQGDDPRARKLEEMQWTYLRLLTVEHALETFLEGERRDDVPFLLSEAEDEVQAIEKEIARLRKDAAEIPASREALLDSRRSRLDVLRERAKRIEDARGNLQLASAELERLDEQAKLIRADTVAASNAGTMSERIDSTFQHLAQTNRWIAEMEQFRDALGPLPQGGMSAPPPIDPAAIKRDRERRGLTDQQS